jgi:hypothetical protein
MSRRLTRVRLLILIGVLVSAVLVIGALPLVRTDAAGAACRGTLLNGGYVVEWRLLPFPHWTCVTDSEDGRAETSLGWWPSP